MTTANAAFAAQDLDSLPPGLSPGDTQAAAQPVDVPNAMPPPLTPEAYQNALSEFWAQQDSLAVAAAPGTPNAAAFAVQPAGLAEQLRLLVESTAPSSDHGDVRAHAINLLAAIERVQPEGGSTAQPTAAFGAAAEHISAHSLPCDDGPTPVRADKQGCGSGVGQHLGHARSQQGVVLSDAQASFVQQLLALIASMPAGALPAVQPAFNVPVPLTTASRGRQLPEEHPRQSLYVGHGRAAEPHMCGFGQGNTLGQQPPPVRPVWQQFDLGASQPLPPAAPQGQWAASYAK